MIIPIRCVSCNNVIAGKWQLYVKRVSEYRQQNGEKDIQYLTNTIEKTAEGRAMDDLKIIRPCCRRHFLTNVDLLL
jgi:DNA-directed RNA polymerase I, II, and III subunit RPABC5